MQGKSKNGRLEGIFLDRMEPLKRERVMVALLFLPQQCCLLFLFRNPSFNLQLNLL
jgi:hypothetical protein